MRAAAAAVVRKAALWRCSGLRAARKVAATFTWTFEDARGRGDRNFPGIKAAQRGGAEAEKGRTKAKTGEEEEEDPRLPRPDLSFFDEVRGSFSRQRKRKARES